MTNQWVVDDISEENGIKLIMKSATINGNENAI